MNSQVQHKAKQFIASLFVFLLWTSHVQAGLTVTRSSGIATTGADGLTVTGGDGTTYQVDGVEIRNPTGIATTGADGIATTGADGIATTGADSFTIGRADGMTIKTPNTLRVTGAETIILTGPNGQTFSITPGAITVTGVDTAAISEAINVSVKGARGIQMPQANSSTQISDNGLQSLDPELALALNQLTDDSNVNAVISYHHLPGAADLADLQRIGIQGGTSYRALPMISVTATRAQLIAISHLASVRSIYGNRTLQTMANKYPALTGSTRVAGDGDLVNKNMSFPVTGRGVTVAVLDTGLDSLHQDVQGRVVQNVKLAETHSVSPGFTYPVNVENLPNTDQLSGHGTFVAGIIAGDGARSQGEFRGVAPGANLIGLSAGDLDLLHVLAGYDYLLEHGASLNVRVVNCSFSANTIFDFNDPVNIATRLLTEHNISVVFSAGNSGAGFETLNPYAIAPWVIGVGAVDDKLQLADFSSRGSFASSLFHPTLVAPGVSIVSLRSASSPSLTGALGVESGTDAQRISADALPFYTTSSGTSFSAPQVAGTIALMLEVNPNLTPAQIRDILQRSATPLPPYYQHEVGAGLLNAYAATLEAAFPERRMGVFRATLNRGQAAFSKEPLVQFNGLVSPGGSFSGALKVPQNSLYASVQIAWGPLTSLNNLKMTLDAPNGTRRASVNGLNLAGLTGKRIGAAIRNPEAGSWQLGIGNTLGTAGTPQTFSGLLDVGKVSYAPLADIGSLSAAQRDAIFFALRNYTIVPYGKFFRPDTAVTRAGLAAALLAGGRLSQYLPARSNYTDVRNQSLMLAVESAQAAGDGPLFTDAAKGGRFYPDAPVTRLAATIALVRAAGWRAEAEKRAGAPLSFPDAASIPLPLRGYVSVAVERGLITASGATNFQPQASFTRLELTQALARLNGN